MCHLIFYQCSWNNTSPRNFLTYAPVSACIFWHNELSLSTLLWLVRTDCEDVFTEKWRVSTSFWLIRSCPCAAFHTERHVCVQLVIYTFVRSGMFPRKCLDLRHLHSQVRTLKRRVSTHFWLTRTCLSSAWHLLSHYFDWCERNIGRVHSKRRYADVSATTFDIRSPVSVH